MKMRSTSWAAVTLGGLFLTLIWLSGDAAISPPNCADTGGNHLNYTAATHTYTCGTSGAGGVTGLANPTASVVLTTTNGSATTAMRSDGAPPLSQSITPTWTGLHTYTNSDIALLGSSTGKTTFTSANASGTNYTLTVPAANMTMAALDVADQTVSGGANVTAQSQSTGNITIDCGSRQLQYITNGGAYTITAPSSDGNCILLSTNNGSAGAITFSGFSVGSNTGDALDTTNAHKFSIFIWRINGTSGYRIAAHQ